MRLAAAFAAFAALAALATTIACASGDRIKSTRTVTAGPALISERALLTGELDALNSVEIAVPHTPSFRLSIQWITEDGIEVKEGDRVAEFDNSQLTSTLAEKELAVLRAGNDLASQVATSRVDVAGKRFAVLEKRIALDKAKIVAGIPKDTLALRTFQEHQLALARAESFYAKAVDDLVAAERAARLDRRIKEIKLDKADRDHKETLAALDTLTLTASRDGIVVVGDNPWEGRKLQVGDNVWPGMKVARLPDLRAMQVRALLADVDDAKLAIDTPVRCRLDAYPERELGGKVVSISPVAREMPGSPLRRAFEVLVDLDKTDGSIMRPGMSVQVEASVRHVDADVAVPRGAIVGIDEQSAVFRPGGERVAVELGACDLHSCAIVSGLAAGEVVLEQGNL